MRAMKAAWWSRFADWIETRAILLLLLAAFVTVALIGVVGMTTSGLVAERVQGTSSAINVAGSLRRLSHRASALVLAYQQPGMIERSEVDKALQELDKTLRHPALMSVLARDESRIPAALHRGVVQHWGDQLRPQLMQLLHAPGAASPGQLATMLADIDIFVEHLNTLVALLEHEAEASVQQLRAILGVALILTLFMLLVAFGVLKQRVFQPLRHLRESAGRIARRDFSARCDHVGRDELGQLGSAFNAMADELEIAYRDLEHRVERKTADLTRSNRSLGLLYHVISRLYHAPADAEAYAETLRDIEENLDLKGSFACVEPKHGGPSAVLFSSMGGCARLSVDDLQACQHCVGKQAAWHYLSDGAAGDVLIVPLRDAENLYGVLRFRLGPGQRLESWQHDLLEALSRHLGTAMGIARQSERARLLALQEERSIIARELHDSLAQSLSYMKIQVSLLGQALTQPVNQVEAETALAALRDGINSAYRQLRELLSSFRLKMDGDFSRLLDATVNEFSERSQARVTLSMQLAGVALQPNQEIHILHLVREALSNAVRHAEADVIQVRLARLQDGQVEVMVRDDGRGFDPAGTPPQHHYGLSIFEERARGLAGALSIQSRPGGGTSIRVVFPPVVARSVVPIFPHERTA